VKNKKVIGITGANGTLGKSLTKILPIRLRLILVQEMMEK